MHLPALDLDLDSQWTLCWISSHSGSSLGTDDIFYTFFMLTISLIFQDQRFLQEAGLNENPMKDSICKYVGKRKRWRNTCNESLDTSVTYWAMKKNDLCFNTIPEYLSMHIFDTNWHGTFVDCSVHWPLCLKVSWSFLCSHILHSVDKNGLHKNSCFWRH